MSRSITVDSQEHWHDLRAKHVGASEIAALFGEHPQLSRFELWHIKAGNIPAPDLSDNDRVFWGLTLEPAIADGIARLKDWTVRKVRRYMTHPLIDGFGASLDYEIVSHDRGPGVLEIKNVDSLVARNWDEGEPPLSHLLQVQAQLSVSGRSWGALGVLVGGNDLRVFEYERRGPTISRIEAAVEEFWKSVHDNKPPNPNYLLDADTLRQLYQVCETGKLVDLTSDNRLPVLCAEYKEATAAEKEASDRKSAIKAEILEKIADAERAICGDFTISAKTIGEKEISYTRSAYRDFRLNRKTSKKEAA